MKRFSFVLGAAACAGLIWACGSADDGATSSSGSLLDAATADDATASFVPDLDSTAGEVDGGDPAIPQCAVGAAEGERVVATSSGLIQGKQAGDTVAFLGVPFASPPVGELRFKPPAPPACWTDVRPATDYGNKCAQTKVVGSGVDGDEDCLTLNIWTPALPSEQSEKLPVLMWMYGGANVFGASNQQILSNQYDGQKLADSQHAVVVSFNYRVGAFGFLAHPALSAESDHKVSGNYGLLDAIQALKWVRANIAKFSGDPSRVMFFGESAGAFNTCALVSSPLAKGLFSAALMQSGTCEAPTMEYRYGKGEEVAKAVKCDGATNIAACLRSASIEDLVALAPLELSAGPEKVDLGHYSDLLFGTSVDGYVLPDVPLKRIAAGLHNPVPMVIGSNANEAEIFVQQGTLLTCGDVTDRLNANFDDASIVKKISDLYPCSFLNPRRSYVDGVSDMVFTCAARRALRAVAKGGKAAGYRYYFKHTYQLGPEAVLRAFHTAEIPFVFGTFSSLGYVPTPGESKLSETIQSYWGHFAATGTPTAAGAPLWEAYVASRDNAIVLDTTIEATDGIQTEKCDFWDSLLPKTP